MLTVAVFTAVLLVGNALREILQLLASTHISPLLMVRAFLYLIPFVWVFALPMGMLTATLLVFGRFSADQELTAARASGVSLLSLVTPVLLLSLLCCALSAYFNMELGPRCRVAYLRLISDFKSEMMNGQLPAGRFIRDFPGYIFFVDKNDGGEMHQVKIWRIKDETNTDGYIWASHGHLEMDRTNNELIIHLSQVGMVNFGTKGTPIIYSPQISYVLMTNLNSRAQTKPKISDMTFLQLRQELHDLENLQMTALPTTASTNVSKELRTQLAAMQKQQQDFIEPVRVAMNREIAFSFACFGFTLVGIPLGIRVHRRETNIGIAMALVLVLVYYAFIMLGASLSARPEFYPHLILWMPNFIFQAVGAVLLWRANRGI